MVFNFFGVVIIIFFERWNKKDVKKKIFRNIIYVLIL